MRKHWLLLGVATGLGLLILLPWLTTYASPQSRATRPRSLSSTPPPQVVINEVAWGGTAASAADEWIELLNTAPVTVDLTGWRLVAADGYPDIALAGAIPPFGYYLIERTADDTVSDVPADLIASFGTGLVNTGETLYLRDAGDAVVDTANGDGGPWPTDGEGGSPHYRAMERVSPSAPDVDASWISNDGSITSGLDADGNPITGTPKTRNAAYTGAWSTGADLVVAKAGPPFAVPGDAMTYTMQLANRGGMTASVQLTDALPLGVTFASQQNSAGAPFTHTARTLRWDLAALAPGDAIALTVTAALSPSLASGAALTNTLTATPLITELNPTDNAAACTTVLVPPSADLVLAKAGPAVLAQGGTLTYTLHLTNAGAYAAQDVVLRDHLPSELVFVSQSSALAFHQAPTPTWQLPALAPGATVRITLVAALQVPLTATARITNTAIVTSDTPELTPGDTVAAWSTQLGAPHLLIRGVLYDGTQLNDADEAIELVNAGAVATSLDGWSLCTEEAGSLACRSVPTVAAGPAETLWLARDAAAFATAFGFSPTAELASWPSLANHGGELLLRKPDAGGGEPVVVDAVVYGDGTLHTGWTGSALTAYAHGPIGSVGQILSRRLDEATGLPVPDTDTAADWLQYPDHATQGRRVRYAGWDMDELFMPVSVTETATVILGIAPDNAFDVISQTLARATESIAIEAYRLTHPALAGLLAKKAAQGVTVTLLLEGNPVGMGDTTPEWHLTLHACQAIETAGGACWFMVHETDDGIYNRYTYLHAKLILVDNTWIAVGSQNLTPDSLPDDPKTNGTTGSRGVLLVTDSPSVVRRARRVLELDLDPARHNDLLRWNTAYLGRYGTPPPDLVLPAPEDGISYTVHFSEPLAVSGTLGFELLTGPDATLRETDSLLGLLARAGAGDEVLVEQQYERLAWAEGHPLGGNPRLAAYIDAARRGARVRVLLNGLSYVEGYPGPDPDNATTVATLNAVAHAETLDLKAAYGNPTGEGIHNKMVLVRSGDDGLVHVGSINGSEVASKVNREVAIQIASDELHAELRRLFIVDWSLSRPSHLPLLMHGWSPPAPPVGYPLISEVAYAEAAAGEWVEIFNPTPDPVDLSTWKLGDAETPDVYEPMFRFPPGTVVTPGATLVVAVNAAAVAEADLEFYESDPAVPNMVVYAAWGDARYPFALRGDGDQVLLLDGSDRPVDVVAWGDRSYPGVVPHPGVVVYGASLERVPAIYDTDNCALDFRERYPPTPGTVP